MVALRRRHAPAPPPECSSETAPDASGLGLCARYRSCHPRPYSAPHHWPATRLRAVRPAVAVATRPKASCPVRSSAANSIAVAQIGDAGRINPQWRHDPRRVIRAQVTCHRHPRRRQAWARRKVPVPHHGETAPRGFLRPAANEPRSTANRCGKIDPKAGPANVYSCSAMNFSASSAAMQPMPAESPPDGRCGRSDRLPQTRRGSRCGCCRGSP